MKRNLFILLLLLTSFNSYSQGFRFTLSNSNIYFEKFNERKVFFSGFAADFTLRFNRLGWNFELDYFLPATYYGQVASWGIYDNITDTIPVYAKGSSYSFGTGISFDIIRPHSEKFKLFAIGGLSHFNHTGKFNKEPFIRIYGGIHDISLSFYTCAIGLGCVYKIGYLPLNISFKRRIIIYNGKYNDFKTSGYYEATIGVSFPIVKSPPPTEIHKISY